MKTKLPTGSRSRKRVETRARGDAHAVRPAQKKILIVDDHPIVREGLRQSIARDPELIVSSEAETAAEALKTLETQKPDLLLVDISLPGKSGGELVKDLRALHPTIPVLVLSMHDEHVYAERMLRAGARGYIMKHEPPQKLLDAIKQVFAGQIYVSEALTTEVLQRLAGTRSSGNNSPQNKLTDRELEVYELIGKGFSTRQIAEHLNLSCKTIQSHREHIKTKLRLQPGSSLVRSAIQWSESLKFQ